MSEQGYQSPATPDRRLSTPEPQRAGSCKTPIQILYEHGVVSGDPPVFVMEKAEGEAHQPSFVFSVMIGGVKCTGAQEWALTVSCKRIHTALALA
ncbi:hypothetical protein CHARACLAT_030777 [Characodon lateralis]|uniref:DRBM domain-containing protein n=1 Tax=Characodon lateralis TaxID=208331 RepID=A0ABU7F7D3_9TELE|nr:hypothetical protein [Characodon lateralis]